MNEVMKLKPELSALIEQAVASGEYPSEEAVVEEALRDWKERRDNHGYTLAELRSLAQEGLESGPGRFGSIDEIKAEARRRFERGHK
jgi:antitoxin ParD1/3/4